MLNLQSLHVEYHGNEILKGISLRVSPGETLVVIGPNGAGKSTLIKAVSGVIHPSQGIVWIDGTNLANLSTIQRARYLAVVPQARLLPPAFTVRQTVLLGRTPYLGWLGRTSRADEAQVERAMHYTHLTDMADRRVGELSGGEQQRVLLARALAQDTPVLLLDEPTTHLDLEHQSSFLNLVKTMVSQRDLAVLMVLHDLNLIGLYADQVALLVHGQLHSMGKPETVLTAKNLSEVYHVPVSVVPHPEYGTPLVLPDGKSNSIERVA